MEKFKIASHAEIDLGANLSVALKEGMTPDEAAPLIEAMFRETLKEVIEAQFGTPPANDGQLKVSDITLKFDIDVSVVRN